MDDYKNKDQLKNDVYKLTLENINRAKSFYNMLIPEKEDINKQSLITVNAEQINNSIRVINECLNTLVKLYSEINRDDANKQDEQKAPINEIYKILDKLAKPSIQREDVIETAKKEQEQEQLVKNFKFL